MKYMSMPKLDLHAVNNPIVKLAIEAMNGRKLSKTDVELFKHPKVKYATSQLLFEWLVSECKKLWQENRASHFKRMYGY
jgi:hypothetical protein